jgi:hypothetical protein
MERCVLIVGIPVQHGQFNPSAQVTEPSVVDVWVLDSSIEMSRYVDGSMDHAPRRLAMLSTLSISNTSVTSHGEFTCKSNELLTLELVCSSSTPRCLIDFWQDKRVKPSRGMLKNFSYATISHFDLFYHRYFSYSVCGFRRTSTGLNPVVPERWIYPKSPGLVILQPGSQDPTVRQ